MARNPEKRYFWADLIRVVAIYLVLVTHLNNLPTEFSANQRGIFVSAALAAACVPLFVILSGALLLDKKENYKSFFRKRFTRLLTPWLTWTFLYSLIAIYNSPTQGPAKIIQTIQETLLSFWFLPFIAGLYLLTPATRIFVLSAKILDIIFIISLWFLTVSFLPYFRNTLAFPLYVDNSLLRQVISFYGYFLLGYLFLITKPNKQLFYVSIVSFVLGLLMAIFNVFIKYSHGYISPGVIFISAGIFGLVYFLANKTNNISIKVQFIVSVMSRGALGVYFIHPLVLFVYRTTTGNNLFLNAYQPIDNFLNAFVLFIASFIIIYILQQIPRVKKIIS